VDNYRVTGRNERRSFARRGLRLRGGRA